MVSSLRVSSSSESLTNITQVKDDLNYRLCSPIPQIKSDIRHFIVRMLAVEGNVKDWEGEVWLGWRTGDNLDQETLAQLCEHSAVVQALLHVFFSHGVLVAGGQLLHGGDGALHQVPAVLPLYPPQQEDHAVIHNRSYTADFGPPYLMLKSAIIGTHQN